MAEDKWQTPFWPWLMRQRRRGDPVGMLACVLETDERRDREVFWQMFKSHANLRRYRGKIVRSRRVQMEEAQAFDQAVAEWRAYRVNGPLGKG